MLLANVLVAAYARGVLRAAVDEGARAASRAPAAAGTCEARAGAALDQLLGALGDRAVVRCEYRVERVVAAGALRMPAWLPGVPAFSLSARATVVREQEP